VKALLLTQYKQLEYVDFPDPGYGPDDLIDIVRACGIVSNDIYVIDESSCRRVPPLECGTVAEQWDQFVKSRYDTNRKKEEFRDYEKTTRGVREFYRQNDARHQAAPTVPATNLWARCRDYILRGEPQINTAVLVKKISLGWDTLMDSFGLSMAAPVRLALVDHGTSAWVPPFSVLCQVTGTNEPGSTNNGTHRFSSNGGEPHDWTHLAGVGRFIKSPLPSIRRMHKDCGGPWTLIYLLYLAGMVNVVLWHFEQLLTKILEHLCPVVALIFWSALLGHHRKRHWHTWTGRFGPSGLVATFGAPKTLFQGI
jgi:hypothetical protein